MLSSLDRAALFFGLESLEQRRMLSSVTASVSSSHVLVITGTSSSNTIVVNKLSNGKVSVSGVSTQFSPGTTSGKFNKISINAGNGNDFVQINNNVPYVSSTISGSNGNDTLIGGVGNDSIDGDNDNDTLSGGGGGADLLRGDAGMDTANYSDRTDNLTISLDGKANDGANGGAEGDNVQTEEVISGSGNDTLIGSPNDDYLDGGAGADLIEGGDGDDDLIGEPGYDTLLGQGGDDLIQAKNNDVDQVSGGTNSGTGSGDLASVDSIDIPAVQNLAIQQIKALAAIQPQGTPTSSNPSDLDTTYGDNGTGYELGPEQGWDNIAAAAIDSQGRVVFVGSISADDGQGEDMAVTRFNADGTLDTGFGYNGEATIDFPHGEGYGQDSQDFAFGVAIASDDSIVVAGSTFVNNVSSVVGEGHTNFAIAKLDNTGQIDDGFGDFGDGTETLDLSLESQETFDSVAHDVAIQSDGSIVIAGDRTRNQQEVTYDPAAEFDPVNNFDYSTHHWTYGYSENLDGPITTYDTPTNVDGNDFWTASQLTNSSTLAPDVVHNNSGETNDGLPDGTLALDPGFYGEYSHVTFTAPVTGSYDINGSFDPALGDGEPSVDVHVLVNGVSQFDKTISGGEGADFSGQLDGFFLNAGDTVDFTVGYGDNQNFDGDTTSLTAEVTRTSAPDDQTLAVARLSSTGNFDASFNGGLGFNFIDVGSDETASSVALQNLPNDFGAQRIVVGGSSDGSYVVARFQPDGTIDTDFGDNGGYTSGSFEGSTEIKDVAVDGNNNIYAVGDEALDDESVVALLLKFDPNGSFTNSVNYAQDGFHTEFNAVSVDSEGRILVAGTNVVDYLVGRYTSDLNFDTTFASGPITTDLSAGVPSDALSGTGDVAVAIGQLSDNKIIAAGSSSYENHFEDTVVVPSAARFVGDQGNPLDIETFIDDLDNPPPDVQARLDLLSTSAKLFIQSAPDADGNVVIHTDNPGSDKITLTTITAADGTKNIAVTINGVTTFYDSSSTNSITINTDGGADSIIADSSIKTKLIVNAGEGDDTVTGGGGTNFLFGGGGNDKITGGSKADLLEGGAGRDTVAGGDGNDIIVGGPNQDSLDGNNGDDILIPGTTNYDTDMTALQSLLAEWSSTDSFTTRIHDITTGTSGGLNDPFYLRATGSNKTVIDDQAIDTVHGESGNDWFFKRNTGIKDLVKDQSGGDVVTNF